MLGQVVVVLELAINPQFRQVRVINPLHKLLLIVLKTKNAKVLIWQDQNHHKVVIPIFIIVIVGRHHMVWVVEIKTIYVIEKHQLVNILALNQNQQVGVV